MRNNSPTQISEILVNLAPLWAKSYDQNSDKLPVEIGYIVICYAHGPPWRMASKVGESGEAAGQQ